MSATAAWNPRREVGAITHRGAAAEGLQSPAHSRLEAGEREVAARTPRQRPRQREPRGVAARGEPFERRAAGPPQAQKPRRLVERFSRRVVEGGPVAPVTPDPVDADELAMPARYQQQQKREWRVAREPRAERMSLKMVDGDERRASARAMAFAVVRPTINPPISPGPRGRDPAQIAEPSPASRIAPAIRPSRCSTWVRAAISGTTPP